MSQERAQDGPRTLQTVSRSIEIVYVLARSGSTGVTELATRLDQSKSTVHTYLKTLEQKGFVVRNGKEYQLAYEILLLGELLRNQHVLFQVGREEIDALAADTGQYAHLSVEENGKAINLYQARGDEAVSHEYQTAKLHKRDHLHITAAGKAILAFSPREIVESILDQHGLPEQTNKTITDREALYDELDDIRDRGYAYNDEEEINGFRAVGAPICRPNGEVVGSLSVSGPTSIFEGERFHEQFPELVTHAATKIEVAIDMSSKYADGYPID